MRKLLEVKNLRVVFPANKVVLDNVSFDIFEGDLISLIGLNGAGKSTILKTICGLIKKTSGEIKKYTDKIFYIPQYHDIDMSFPVTVKEFINLYGTKKYPEYIKELEIEELLPQKISSLSGGELQRLLIAIALSHEPDLLLLDEPTSGIDIVGEDYFYQIITKVNQINKTAILMVSHDLHLVFKFTNKVICLSNHICCQGTPQEVSDMDDFKNTFGKFLKPYIHHHQHKH